ncbi:unnamed protein product [Euphydryas editha]|uniref:Uncharacterized protein n=1 Tax=Euphydryas editha TaxID=104508 RepID=A0AAU9UBG0_EUPED|nr:unnamed protein product [Euphydryas editha]
MSSKNVKCAACHKWIHTVPGKIKKITNADEVINFSRNIRNPLNINDIICGNCRVSAYKRRKIDCSADQVVIPELIDLNTSAHDIKDSEQSDPTFSVILNENSNDIHEVEYVELPISRTVSTHKYCCVCNCEDNLTQVPEEALNNYSRAEQ